MTLAADVELAQVSNLSKTAGPQTSADRLVVFHQPFDPENPKDWPERRKWAVTNVLSATGFNRIMVSTIMAPAMSQIAGDLKVSSTESAMALSIYLLATAFGPLFIGPLSEVYGRQVVLHVSNVWFLIWNIACGFANTKELLIGSRFLAGFGASSIYALAGGVLGDVWRPEQRGRSMGLYLAIPLVAVAVGPIVGGFMTSRATWRWMFWSTSIFQAVMVVFSLTTFRETYAPVILARRAARLRRETGDERYQTPDERLSRHNKPLAAVLGRALSRPLRLLLLHPIIQVCALVSAFNYGVLYIVLSSFAAVWTERYGLSVELSGLHYIACALGELLGSQLGAPLMDRLFRRAAARSPDSAHAPEQRMPLVYPGAVVAPLGLFVYGWAAQYRVHWAVVDVGIFVAMFGQQIAGMPLQAYLMDAYEEHTSSALSAAQFLRSLTAFCFPLFAPRMYEVLGYGWGNSAMGFTGLVLGLVGPSLIWGFGARLRARAQSSF